MALKNYKVKPSASTETNLIPVSGTLSGVDVIILSLEISAPTAAAVTVKRNDGTNDYQAQSFSIDAGDTVVLDHKIVIPDGHKMTVESDQADTEFTANVNEG
jgi:plastocyanin